jgi:multiple sugar transport system substrate-binding protein
VNPLRWRRVPTCLCLAAGCLVVATTAGICAPAREQIQLAVWHEGERGSLTPLAAVLRAAQVERPGLVVTLRHYPPEEAYRRLQEWSAPGALAVPDVVVVQDLWLPHFASFLQPINTLVRWADLRRFPEPIRARLRRDSTLYGVPWSVDARVLYVRPDVLTAAGVLPPRTWPEVLNAARRCHRPPAIYGFGLPGLADGGAPEALLQMLWAYGTDLPPIHDPTLLDRGALDTSLGLLSDLHAVAQPEVLSWDQVLLQQFFVQGRLAMLVAPAAFQDQLPAAGAETREGAPQSPPLAWQALPLPRGSQSAGFVGLEMACVSRRTHNLEACGALLRALSSAAGAEALTALGSVPVGREAVAAHGQEPRWAAATADLEQARGLPPVRWDSAAAALSEGVFGLLTGRQTVPEAAATIRSRLAEGEPLTR